MTKCVFLACLLAAPLPSDDSFSLAVGQQRVVNVTGMTRVAVAKEQVADIKVLGPSEVLITALSAGQTEVTIFRGSAPPIKYSVQVTAADVKAVLRDVKKMLGDREGITATQQGDRVFLEGFALTLDDMQRVEQVTQLYPQVVKNQVRLDPSAKNLVAQQLNSALQRAGLRGAVATVVGSTVFVEGKVDSEGDMKKAELVMKSMGENIQNLLTLGSTKMIALDVEFMEVSTNVQNNIGISYPLNISGTPTMTFNASRVWLPAGQPDALNLGGSLSATSQFGFGFLFTNGITRTLARPRLVCASGQKASFLAGGEIPIPLVTAQTVSLQYKEYGIRLGMTPIADARAIHLEVEAEVSDIDESVAVNNIPGLRTNKVKTSIAVRSGETIALSGLMSNVSQKNVSKLPLLGSIPILGELFKSHEFLDKKSDLVIFVTPRLVDADDEALKQSITDMTERLDRAQQTVKWGVFD